MKKFSPVTASLRGTIMIDRSELHKGGALKKLVQGGGYRAFGRSGRISAWKKGGGAKRAYRHIDFKRSEEKGEVLRVEYDPNRSAFIALLQHDGDRHSYILAPERIKAGDVLQSGSGSPIKVGNSLPLLEIPTGTSIHNIEMKRGKGGQMVRSAGCSATLMSKVGSFALVKLASGEVRKIDSMCFATVGSLSNPGRQNVMIGKAGRSRNLGRKPTVRGVAMNPVDHPHGGGEGKTSGGKHPRDPWGRKTKGLKTRKSKLSDKLIVRKRSAKK